jgi:hypothetical protein
MVDIPIGRVARPAITRHAIDPTGLDEKVTFQLNDLAHCHDG